MRHSWLFAALSLCFSMAQAQTVLKFSHVVADDTPKGQAALKFKELVEARSNGKYVVEVFPNSQLYNDDKVMEALLLGDVHFAAPALSKFDRITKKLQVFDLPFLFKDMAAVQRFQESPEGQALLKSVEGKGLVGLGYLHNGLKQFSANSPVVEPADLKGKKMRIQASNVLAAQMEAVGAIPLKKPFSEVFTLLQTKAIDGQESPWSNTYSQKFYEVQSHITVSNHGLLEYLAITSQSFWKGLSDEDRTLLKTALDEALQHGNQLAGELDARDRKRIEDSKLSTIIELTPEQRQAWVDAMRPVWKKFEKDIGADVIRAAEASNQ